MAWCSIRFLSNLINAGNCFWQLSTSNNHVLLLCANMSKPVLRLRRSCEAWSFVVSGNIPGCSGVLRRLMVCIVNFHIGIIFICIKKWKKSRIPVQRAAKERCDKYDNTAMLFSHYIWSNQVFWRKSTKVPCIDIHGFACHRRKMLLHIPRYKMSWENHEDRRSVCFDVSGVRAPGSWLSKSQQR